MSFFNALYLSFFFAVLSGALRTAPDSPCSSLCSSRISNSSSSADSIVCVDSDYHNTERGKQTQQCLSCLQTSSYSSASESDQIWFLYNLRLTLGSCILGFNSTTGSGPCSTSTACGSLSSQWLYGDLNSSSATETGYGYCTQPSNGSSAESSCLSCVQSDSSESFLANFIIAVQAGCDQKPANGSTLSLSASVFSNTTISSTSATAAAQTTQATAAQPALPLPAIIGIVVGGILVLFGALAGYFCIRRRKTASMEHNGLEAALHKREKDGKKKAKRDKRRTLSSLSFRCITRVTPVTPSFPQNTATGHTEKPVLTPPSNRHTSPYNPAQVPDPDPWNAYLQTQRYTYIPPSTGTFTTCTTTFYSAPRSVPSIPRGIALPTITTTVTRSADDLTPTPSSTHSTAPLLKTAHSPPAVYVSSARLASPEPLLSPPLLSPSAWPMPAAAQNTDQRRRPSLWFRQREMPRRISGSPAETISIKSAFDPPPTRALS